MNVTSKNIYPQRHNLIANWQHLAEHTRRAPGLHLSSGEKHAQFAHRKAAFVGACRLYFRGNTAARLQHYYCGGSDYDAGSIHITQPWARATPKGAKSGAGYMTITNKGKTPDRVNCVSSDASAQCFQDH